MLLNIGVVTTPAQTLAVLPLHIPRSRMVEMMGPAHQELAQVLAAQGQIATGPWFTHHFRITETEFDFEVGMPVAERVRPSGRVQSAERPVLRVARAIYQGPYAGLGQAWEALQTWIRAQRLHPTTDLWETYQAGPETGTDSSLYQTLLERPLRGAGSSA